MKKFFLEDRVLDAAYGLIDAAKTFSLEKAARALVPAVAFTYALGTFTGDWFHKIRHTLEDHLVL